MGDYLIDKLELRKQGSFSRASNTIKKVRVFLELVQFCHRYKEGNFHLGFNNFVHSLEYSSSKMQSPTPYYWIFIHTNNISKESA